MANEDMLPDDQQEGLEDLNEAGRRYTAVINQADWTVETIIQQIDKGNIELNPDFQRREAWRLARKSQYIESLILNVPVPQIVLAERKDKRGKFIVIDGKQRLLTIRQFYANSDDKIYNGFSLSGLTIRSDLNGMTYGQLKSDFLLESDVSAFENSTIRTAVIRNWDDENFLYTVFLRLNTGSVMLSPQELRQALHPGKFVRFIDEYSIDSNKLQIVLGLVKPDPRMRDAELVIRYFAFRNFLQTYNGNLKPLLDRTANHFNKVWDTDNELIMKQISDFEKAVDTTIEIFSEKHSFRKWNGERFESAFNRAIFDIMIYYFTDNNIASFLTPDRKISIVEEFKIICRTEEFRSYIEGTTKSIDAIYGRIRIWGEVLQMIGLPVNLPILDNNKIMRTGN